MSTVAEKSVETTPEHVIYDKKPVRKVTAGSRRRARAMASNKPTILGYVFLSIVLLGALFPLYWTFLIGSGDSSTINKQDIDWLPGGNFLKNAATVLENPSVNFWKALMNSIIVSTVVSFSVVFFSTLAGYAFAKLRFAGNKGLLIFVIATWTNFFWPFIILDSNNPTLPVALSLLQNNFFIDYSIVLAGVMLSTIPLLILFVVAGKQLVSGIMQGAVKG